MERTAKHFRKRDAILSCLRGTTDHPSAEWIYNRLKPEIPDISLGTVYSGLMLQKHVAKPAMIVMEANQDMLYSGTIKAGSRVITHLVFELQEQPDDNSRVYVYFGGTYRTIIWEK